MHYYGGYGDYGMSGWGFGIVGLIIQIAVVVFVIWLVISLLRGFGMTGRRRWMWHTHSALSILNERFAKGEIDAKEYEERKKALMGDMK